MTRSPERPEMGLSEKDVLFARAKIGDKNAQGAIFRDYAPRLIAIARAYNVNPEDAEEVVSECFPEAFEDVARFQNSEDFLKTMSRVVRNKIFNRMTANSKTRDKIARVAQLEDMPEAGDPEAQLLRAQDKKFVHELLARMEPKQATLLCLREFDGLSYSEMSDNLGISEVEAIEGYIAARKRFQQLAHEEKGKFGA